MKNLKELILDKITSLTRNLDDLSDSDYRNLKPFLNALVKKEVFAVDFWSEDKEVKAFVLLDFSTSGILVCKGNINWKTGDSPYAPHMFYWKDYGILWACTKEEINYNGESYSG